jgi:cell division protein FtsB
VEHVRALDQLATLEERISETARRFSSMKAQYRDLQEQKRLLERELDALRSSNRELAERIHNLESIDQTDAETFNKEEVRRTIDRVLERFGELPL